MHGLACTRAHDCASREQPGPCKDEQECPLVQLRPCKSWKEVEWSGGTQEDIGQGGMLFESKKEVDLVAAVPNES